MLVDVALAEDLKANPKVRALEGSLLEVTPELPDASLDVILCLSVLEHLWEPERALAEFHRLLAPGAVTLINVPSWLGKPCLELAAFRLGVEPRGGDGRPQALLRST